MRKIRHSRKPMRSRKPIRSRKTMRSRKTKKGGGFGLLDFAETGLTLAGPGSTSSNNKKIIDDYNKQKKEEAEVKAYVLAQRRTLKPNKSRLMEDFKYYTGTSRKMKQQLQTRLDELKSEAKAKNDRQIADRKRERAAAIKYSQNYSQYEPPLPKTLSEGEQMMKEYFGR